jgi:hypothetical protein
MSKASFIERITAMDKPDDVQETEQIWRTVRAFLGLMRVVIFILIIAIADSWKSSSLAIKPCDMVTDIGIPFSYYYQY